MKFDPIFSKTLLLAAILAGASCKKAGNDVTPVIPPTISELTAPNGFSYQTSKTINLQVKLLAPNGEPLKNVLVHVYDNDNIETAQEIFTALTDAGGRIDEKILVPSYIESIVVDPAFIGIMQQVKVGILAGTANCTIGGTNGYSGNVIPKLASLEPDMNDAQQTGITVPYVYMGTYDSQGVPSYLVSANDVISSNLLQNMNTSLPEKKPVPTYHPDYLNPTAATNFIIKEKSDVWITFLHEGAGYSSSLAYYTYPTGKTPKTVQEIKALNIILPNASLNGSGGGLTSGNKVLLGRFDAGTTIAFALIANGWNRSTKSVDNGTHIIFSDDELNTETEAKQRRHTILLHDADHKLFLVGFEDQNRDGASDNDFNDLIFYGTSNPVTAISTEYVNQIDKPVDTDNDGVTDVYDAFPKDPSRAYIQYFPAKNVYGTLAFEDLWPYTGDYDMNDLVVNYRYSLIKNASNKLVDLGANYAVGAIGAAFANGFGVQFPFAPTIVKSVTGGKLTGNFPIQLNSNGLEAGQSKAVIIPFDNAFSMVNRSSGMVNTIFGQTIVPSDTLDMLINFTSPTDLETLGTFPFNPFLISNKKRTQEVHLPDMKPTDLADTKSLNTGADNSIPSQNKYYKTKNNMPFALNFIDKFNNPAEKINVQDAYLKYIDWVRSGGSVYPDWYSNTSAGYRVSGRIILK